MESFADLIRTVSELRNLVSSFQTTDALTRVARERVQGRDQLIVRFGLSAPMKQLNYLVGLLLSTPEPSNPRAMDDRSWTECCERLERAFRCYQEHFAQFACSDSGLDLDPSRVETIEN